MRAEHWLHGLVWGPWLAAALLGTGVVLTVYTGGFHLRRLGKILRRTAGTALRGGEGKVKKGKQLTSRQAVWSALAATVGTGNIAGVTGAIFLGGPGAVFWMWVSALFGMCTKFAEIALAARYREDRGGRSRGGPMYYITIGLGRRFLPLAWFFALAGGMACFGIGNLAQSSEIAGAAEALLGLPRALTAGVLAFVVALTLLGGVKGAGRAAEKLVPVMACFYLLCGGTVILLNLRQLPLFFGQVMTGAFGWQAMGGGFCGAALAAALRQGVARGVFSNEAGLGSAALIHGSARGEPFEQGLWGVFEVFIDTVVVCTVTAFAVVVSGVADTPGGLAAFPSAGMAAAAAFDMLLPLPMGGAVVQLSMLFFAFTSILGWSICGETCWRWLGRGSKAATGLYRAAFALAVIPGALGSGQGLWELSDTLNGLMALPNLAALLLLAPRVREIVRKGTAALAESGRTAEDSKTEIQRKAS